jgi:hypothetical protein
VSGNGKLGDTAVDREALVAALVKYFRKLDAEEERKAKLRGSAKKR